MSRHSDKSALVARMAEVIVRHLNEIDRFPWTRDAAEAASFRILADEEIAAGLAALPVLAALAARHQPREWAGSSTGSVCTCGAGAYPCADRAILDGDLAAAVTR